MLRENGQHDYDIARFEERWPNGVEVTPENCMGLFCEMVLNFPWAAGAFLTKDELAEFLKAKYVARDEYQMRIDFAATKCAGSWCGPLDPAGEYNKVKATKEAERDKTKAIALAEYLRACVIAFYDTIAYRPEAAGE